jgi:Lysozyme like domain
VKEMKKLEKADDLRKASAKVIAIHKEQAKARLRTLGLGGVAIMLAGGLVAIGTTEAVAPTKAEAITTQQSKQVRIFAKYVNADSLTDSQLIELLSAVGFKGQDLKEAWAVAKKESRGNPLSHNGNRKTGDNSYGLFQVNMLGSLGDTRRDKFNLVSNAELFNPVVNAQIAYHMSGGGKDWSAWKGMKTKAVQFWLKKFPTKMQKS